MNLHPMRSHYDRVECSGKMPRGNVQHFIGHRLCFRTRDIVLCQSQDVDIVQDAGGVFDTGRKKNCSLGGETRSGY